MPGICRLKLKTGENATPHPLDFEAVLEEARGRPEEHLLTSMALRSMAMALYEPAPKGHFGLALEHYCHFTSPIRRYPDLQVHRTVDRLIREQSPAGDPLLTEQVIGDLTCGQAPCSKRNNASRTGVRLILISAAIFS